MIGLALLIASIAYQAPSRDEARDAIFEDLNSTAMLGGGNPAVTMDWLTGKGGAGRPRLDIAQFKCNRHGSGLICNFILERAPASDATNEDIALSRQLSCSARLAFDNSDGRGKNAWHVVRHMAPHNRGPALTTMMCTPT